MPREDSWRLEEGDEVVPGRYAVQLLGGGRRYEAYLAWDEGLLTLVTIKVLRPGLLEDEGARKGLAGEALMLAATRHPAIVRAFDADLDAERPHVVLEYLDGPRLSTLVRRYGITLEQLLPLALEVCSALHYLERRRIVHLDVKPRNIIMSASPRLIDLSVAMWLDEVPSIQSQIGTDAYMAPEQCVPERFHEIGPPSDVWGLGVTLFEALARELPFQPPSEEAGASLVERYPQVVALPRALPSSAPAAVAETILSCLEKRPENRPRAEELHARLEPWVASLPGPRLGLFRPGGRIRRSIFELR